MGEGGDRRTTTRFLRRLGIAVAGLTGMLFAAVALIIAFGVPISLDGFRPDVEAAAGDALGRGFSIEGPLTLLPALPPTIEAESVRVADVPESDDVDLVRIARARITVELLPLLRREIRLDSVAIDGLAVHLRAADNGEDERIPEAGNSEKAAKSADGAPFEFVRLGALSIHGLTVYQHDETSGERIVSAIEIVEGSAGRDDPTRLSAEGTLKGRQFTASATGGTLAGLGDPDRPWPLEAHASLPGAEVMVRGGIANPLGAARVDLGIEGTMGGAGFRGEVALDTLSSPPRLTGAIDLETLDLTPFLTDEPRPSDGPARVSLDDAFPSLQGLHDIDGRIALTVDRVLGLPMEIRDASVSASLEGGRLTVPVSGTLSEVPVDGSLSVVSAPERVGFELALASEGSDIENLRAAAKRAANVRGSYERLTLHGSGTGHNLRTALEDLDFRMELERADLSYGHEEGRDPVPLTVEKLELALPRGKALRLAMTASLFDRVLAVDVTGATVAEALSGGRWPISLSVRGSGTRLTLEGEMAGLGDPSGTELELDYSGKRVGDLASWAGTSPDADADFRLRGTVRVEDERIVLESIRGNLGETAMTGELSAGRKGHEHPLDARLRFSRIATAELGAIFASRDKKDEGAERPGLNLHMPILPYEVNIADADFDIRADRILLQPIDVTDARFSGRIRDGRLKNSPFAATIGKVPFSGGVSLDLRGRVPVATLDVGSENVDVGSLLEDLRIVASSETKARRLHASMVFRGSDLKSIIKKSEISAVLEDGVAVVRDPNTQTPLEIRIARSTLTSVPGEPVVYEVRGRIESTPVTIRVELSPLASILESHDRVPVQMTADVAGLNVEMRTNLAPPFSLRNIRFDLSARGPNLDTLDELLHVSVPPWGPYSIDGTIQLDRIGYHVPRLEVRVGSSHLSGDVSLDTTGSRPRLVMNLNGKTLQLDDFKAGNWSAFEYNETDAPPAEEESRASSRRERKETVKALATSDSLRSMDARMSLVVNEVLSGADRLGSGRLEASLDDGRLTLDPVSVALPEGSAEGLFSFELTEDAVASRTRIQIDHLDYGILARRIDSEADAEGWLSLDLDLQSRSDTLEDLMASANGQFDFAVWPKNMQADIFDLWAANLLFAILPNLDPESGSRVNCVVGVFDATDGILRQKRFLVDTTNVQVVGEGEVDFQSGEVDFVLTPDAKRPQMFVLGTPIRVSGNYRELETSTSAEQLARTAGRFVTSIFAPINRLFTTPIPADGEAACLAAMERPTE